MPKTVVVTGCFQILHRGHKELLSIARCFGNVIILLNDDESVLSMKGYLSSPYKKRKANLFKSGLIKAVLPIGSDPTEAIRKLKPDFIVVGPDHSFREVFQKGGEFASKVVKLNTDKDISSSELYKRGE